jgi:hypothetical protein
MERGQNKPDRLRYSRMTREKNGRTDIQGGIPTKGKTTKDSTTLAKVVIGMPKQSRLYSNRGKSCTRRIRQQGRMIASFHRTSWSLTIKEEASASIM